MIYAAQMGIWIPSQAQNEFHLCHVAWFIPVKAVRAELPLRFYFSDPFSWVAARVIVDKAMEKKKEEDVKEESQRGSLEEKILKRETIQLKTP